MSVSDKQKLALIAGNGELPELLLASAQKQGYDVSIIAVTKDAYKRLKSFGAVKFSPVEVKAILEAAINFAAEEVTFIGKVPKLDFFRSLHKLDLDLLERVKSLKDLNDDSLHDLIVDFVEKENGLKIIEQRKFLEDLFPAAQVLSKRQPTEVELEDIAYGLRMAKAIAAEDIGQTVVVENKTVVAVESIEGTNECIKRARKLTNNPTKKFFKIFQNLFKKFQIQGLPNKDEKSDPGANELKGNEHSAVGGSVRAGLIVCKVAKPNQDQRFDIPTVGLQTLKAAGPNTIVAFEAKETFLVNADEAIEYADQNNICLVSKSYL